MTAPAVLFSGRAKRHLRAIERYIARKASPREAAAYVERIVRRCDRIALAPLQGERPDELRPGLRKTGMEGRVAILFIVNETTVTILSIACGGRQFESDFRGEGASRTALANHPCYPHPMRIPPLAATLLLLATGCHSAFIEATLSNRTPTPITLVELDYPSASFGTQTLAPGADFHYRFKVLGSGPLKFLYTDQGRHDHTLPGPTLQEGDEGALTITLTPAGVDWSPHLTNRIVAPIKVQP